jgi:hypothetical protein
MFDFSIEQEVAMIRLATRIQIRKAFIFEYCVLERTIERKDEQIFIDDCL